MTDVRRNNLRGIAFMLLAVGNFALMDAGLKVLAPHYPPLQVAAVRGLASLPVVLLWAALAGGLGQLVRIRPAMHLLRGVLGIGMLAAFAFALQVLPLAEAYAIFFVTPLMITALAVPMLGERVDARRWIAIAVGMLGVVIVLRPTGQGMLSLPGLAMLGCALAYALSAITVRVLGKTDTTQAMVFWLMLFVGVGAGALAWPQWRAIDAGHGWLIAGIAVTGAVGQYAVTEAFRIGEASVIAPLEYTALAWALLLDRLVWHTVPDRVMLIGAGVIIASGIYLVRRERAHAAHAEAEHP